MLVDVELLVRWREHFALVDVVRTEGFEYLRLDEVADPCLRHHGDRHRLHDALDQIGIAHPRDAALRPDTRGYALQRHPRAPPRLFGNLRLLRVDDVHDHAALEHLRQTGLRHPRRLRDAVAL